VCLNDEDKAKSVDTPFQSSSGECRINRVREIGRDCFMPRSLPVVIAAGLLLAAVAFAGHAQSISNSQRGEIEKIIREYLIANPEVLQDAMNGIEKRQAMAESDNDGQRDYVLPNVQGAPAMTGGCPCMQMMSGGMGGMGQRGMMQPDDQGGMNMPGMEGMLQRIMPKGTTPRSTLSAMGGMCGGGMCGGGMCGGGMCSGGATGAAGRSASAFSQQRAAAGNQPGDKTLLAGAEDLFRTNPLLMPTQSTPKGSITARGTILSVDPRTRSINLIHAPIPAINWPAMTMDFAVGPEVDLSTLKASQWVEFTMEPQSGGGDSYTITQVRTKD
jgi:Cu(I)/Ag(I) efflux system protein CusF